MWSKKEGRANRSEQTDMHRLDPGDKAWTGKRKVEKKERKMLLTIDVMTPPLYLISGRMYVDVGRMDVCMARPVLGSVYRSAPYRAVLCWAALYRLVSYRRIQALRAPKLGSLQCLPAWEKCNFDLGPGQAAPSVLVD